MVQIDVVVSFPFFRVYVYDTAACDECYVPKLIYEVRADEVYLGSVLKSTN